MARPDRIRCSDTKPGMPNHSGDHSSEYPGLPEPKLD